VNGSIEENVRLNVAGLSTDHPFSDSLAEMAFSLARSLDKGCGLAEASVNRELRATLEALIYSTQGEDDDLSVAMSTPVRDPQED
jgi:hypothetical protein